MINIAFFYCDKCGSEIRKSHNMCPSCHKIIHWKWDGGWIFGVHKPEGIKEIPYDKAEELREKWKEKLEERYRKKGIFSYWGYKLFGEPSKVDRRRRRATMEEIAEVMRKHGHRCVECGSPYDLTIDHKIPLTKGGDWDLDNLRPLCRKCNSKKGNR